MQPVGYVVLQHSERLDRPVAAYQQWITEIPSTYRESVLGLDDELPPPTEDDTNWLDNLFPPSPENDPDCLALIKHYRSLMPTAQEARKPIFDLKPADGAIGAHFNAVKDSYLHFKKLSQSIANRCSIPLPSES